MKGSYETTANLLYASAAPLPDSLTSLHGVMEARASRISFFCVHTEINLERESPPSNKYDAFM